VIRRFVCLDWSQNRRNSHRYASAEVRISLQWWEGNVAHESLALLLDVRRGGALLRAEHPPPLDQSIRLQLQRTGRADWVDARVVRLSGAHEVAVAFRDVSLEAFVTLVPHTSHGEPGIALPHITAR
jgi:hypothetical protein